MLYAHLAVLVSSALITAGLCVYAWSRRSRPGALAFTGLTACMTVWTGSYAIALPTLSPTGRVLWENVQWFGIAFVPVFFLLFVLEYTGERDLLTSKTALGLSIVPAISVLLVWTNPWHGLVWEQQRIVVYGDVAIVAQQFGLWYWVNMLYTYLLIGACIFLLFRSFRSENRHFRWQSTILLVGTAVPIVANMVSVFGDVPLEGIDLTPYSFSIAGALYGFALFDYEILDRGPATVQIGETAAIEGLAEGVLLTDTEGWIVSANRAAIEMLATSRPALLGTSIEPIVDVRTFGEADEPIRNEFERDDRSFDVTVTPLDTDREHTVGYTVLLSETTSRERRIRLLRRQREELETLERINDVIRDVNRALVSATTRAEIETAVSRRLESSRLFTTVEFDDDSGIGSNEDVRRRTDHAGQGGTVGVRPPSTGSLVSAEVSVPITYGEAHYGTLRLRADRTDGFSERERDVLAELGELVGLAINGVKSRKLLVADTVVELRFRCTDPAEQFVALSERTDCRFDLEGVVTASGDSLLVYHRVTGATVESILDAVDESAVSVRRIRGDDEEWIGEFSLRDRTVLVPLLEHGAHLRSATIDSGELRLEVDVGDDADAQALEDALSGVFPRTRAVAKRERDRTPVETSPDGEFDCDLTDRQFATLEAAHRAGYFEWPRKSTAEEVAESMGVSPPTLHNHLRKAEGKLVDSFFADSRDERERHPVRQASQR